MYEYDSIDFAARQGIGEFFDFIPDDEDLHEQLYLHDQNKNEDSDE